MPRRRQERSAGIRTAREPSRRTVAVLMAEVNPLQAINDRHGHPGASTYWAEPGAAVRG